MLKIAGYFFLVLAAIGIALPLLPTTPFLLIAAMCFAKSSPEIHAKLLKQRVFGPILQDWEDNKCTSCKVKALAISSVTFFTGFSVWFLLKSSYAKAIGVLIIIIAVIVILKIPTCKPDGKGNPPSIK